MWPIVKIPKGALNYNGGVNCIGVKKSKDDKIFSVFVQNIVKRKFPSSLKKKQLLVKILGLIFIHKGILMCSLFCPVPWGRGRSRLSKTFYCCASNAWPSLSLFCHTLANSLSMLHAVFIFSCFQYIPWVLNSFGSLSSLGI